MSTGHLTYDWWAAIFYSLLTVNKWSCSTHSPSSNQTRHYVLFCQSNLNKSGPNLVPSCYVPVIMNISFSSNQRRSCCDVKNIFPVMPRDLNNSVGILNWQNEGLARVLRQDYYYYSCLLRQNESRNYFRGDFKRLYPTRAWWRIPHRPCKHQNI